VSRLTWHKQAAGNLERTLAYEVDSELPHPSGSGWMDRTVYRAVHFYGAVLSQPLAEAAHYIEQLEQQPGQSAQFLGLHNEFSGQDEGSDIAWRVTVVFSEPFGIRK
jgi:hypothetical protein